MIRAVLDTNVFVSGILRFDAAQSPPAQMLHHWLADDFGVVTSVPLRREIERTLANPYFAARIPHAVGLWWLRSLDELAVPIEISLPVTGVATHPEDDLILATAASAAADYLVTGDRQLQRLGAFEGATIVSPSDFLDILLQPIAADQPDSTLP